MSQIETCFRRSFSAFEAWYLQDAEHRCSVVVDFISSLPESLKPAAQFQLEYSRRYCDRVHQLTGPTGETNELYTTGRGAALLVVESGDGDFRLAATAMLTSMLVAGNSVIVCCDDEGLRQDLLSRAREKMAVDLIQILPLPSYKEVVATDIRSFAYIGDQTGASGINALLAEREGAIVAPVTETEPENLKHSQDPALVLRFITERTRTINITAVGGNATLLELGSEHS